MKKRTVIIVGAGLAGLSAAIELIERGHRPIVVEANPYVGGRTASWNDAGMYIETGLHRYLGFYSHLPKLLRKSGIHLHEVIYWEDATELRLPNGRRAVYHTSIHRPIRTILSLSFNNRYLNWRAKWQLARLFTAGLYDYYFRAEKLKSVTVERYVHAHRLGKPAQHRLVSALCESLCFAPPATCSAYELFSQVAPYLFRLWKFRIGGFKGGMTEVMTEPLARVIRAHGGEVHVNTAVERLLMRDDRVIGVATANGQTLQADWVVLATPLGVSQDLTRQAFTNARWCRDWHKLRTIPVVSLQLELNKPAVSKDRRILTPDSEIAAFAEQSRTTFSHADGRLSLILSQQQKFSDEPVDTTLQTVYAELKRLGLDVVDQVKAYRKLIVRTSTYQPGIGSEVLRPPQTTPVFGLTLAGDYTKQRYQATMEGAVYSGKLAAAIVAKSLKRASRTKII